MGIPVYLICGMPVEQISGWLLGCATEVFASFEEFHEFINGERLSESVKETGMTGSERDTRRRDVALLRLGNAHKMSLEKRETQNECNAGQSGLD